ncbi:MAG: MCE family protein [Parachlamydiaceae bacterium]|nr:MCE family protein [Parachlamydiaceae bacterium]
MADQFKNVIIGIFVLTALAIVVFILLFLHPTVGDEGQKLLVRFRNIDKVNVGTQVTFAGKPVGEVVEIRSLNPGREPTIEDEDGHIYVYELELLIDSKVKVFDVDEFALHTAGLLGERSIAIMPYAAKPGQEPLLVKKGKILYAVETGSVEEAIRQFKTLAVKFGTALDHITETLEDVKKEELVKYLGNVAKNLDDITTAINRPEELSNIIDNVHQVTQEFARRLPTSWDKLDVSLENFQHATEHMHIVAGNVRKGEGSFGKLLKDEDIYLNLKSLLNKAEIIADDVNHYGLMFQNDKGWQRLRARRMNMLSKLSTPQEFRNYFNDEIDQITTSLSRVSMVLERTESSWPYNTCYSLIEDENFTKVFAELLRRVGDMEESLQMYNQQVVDIQVHDTELSPCCN